MEAVEKTWSQKASGLTAMHGIDDEETTDVGQSSGSASETESSSGVSGNEGSCSSGKRCRFGRTPLETIPATPSAGAAHLGSPPGFSRAAMRQARDVCRHDASVSISKNLCRFGESALETVPKTPVSGAKWKALAMKLGSPPGLSRTEMREARDACKGAAPTTRGSCQVSSAERPTKRSPAGEAVFRMKHEASLLKDLKVERSLDNVEDQSKKQDCPSLGHDAEGTLEAVHSSCSQSESSTDLSSSDGQQCRFGTTLLGTIPSTPVTGQMSLPSPPGLSRKAMRQARDACTKALMAMQEGYPLNTSQVANSIAPR